MEARLSHQQVAPQIVQAAIQLQAAIEATGIEKTLMELIKLRASQINGCAYCLNMHTRDALKHGVGELRIVLLSAWRESTLYTPRERAVLEWVESLTQVAKHGAPDEQFQALREHFDEKQLVGLTAAVAMINFWNRVAIGFAQVWPNERDGAASRG
jgi:AhpD family alkylhydroperoxidase